MKLFKKLAAVALAAVLALSMVGCGKGGAGNAFALKNEALNYICDQYYMDGKTANHDTKLDSLAAELVAAADKQTGDTAQAKLQAAAADEKFNGYVCIPVESMDLSTTLMQQMYLEGIYDAVESATSTNDTEATEINIGAATGKIGDKTYVVILAQVVKTESSSH